MVSITGMRSMPRTEHLPRTATATATTRLKRNDVFLKNGDRDSYAVVIEEHRNNGEVRWVRQPVPFHATAGRACSVDRFLEDHTRVDADTALAKSVVKGAHTLVEILPAPSRWGG